MKKIRKAICTVALGVMMTISVMSTTMVYAASEGENFVVSNEGVSFEEPGIFNDDARGVNYPEKVWNVKKKGKYSFKGSSYYKALYTNYEFTGKTSYKVYVKNTGKSEITVKAMRVGKTYAFTTIAAGKTGSFEFSGITSSKSFVLYFNSKSEYSFSGYIQ